MMLFFSRIRMDVYHKSVIETLVFCSYEQTHISKEKQILIKSHHARRDFFTRITARNLNCTLSTFLKYDFAKNLNDLNLNAFKTIFPCKTVCIGLFSSSKFGRRHVLLLPGCSRFWRRKYFCLCTQKSHDNIYGLGKKKKKKKKTG